MIGCLKSSTMRKRGVLDTGAVSPTGQNASPAWQASAGHNSKPSELCPGAPCQAGDAGVRRAQFEAERSIDAHRVQEAPADEFDARDERLRRTDIFLDQ